MTYQRFQFECFRICMAFGHKDMREENSQLMIKFFSIDVLDAVVNNKIEFISPGEHWSGWFVALCKKELDDRLDGVLLG